MLSAAKVEEVRRLLAEGNLSQRQVAKLLVISRGSVRGIASGKRPDYTAPNPDDDDCHSFLPPARCPGCGGMVHGRCRLCRVRAITVRQQILARLRGKDRQRAAG